MTWLRFAPYVVKTCLRARTRSALTVLGTALALALFTFVRTLEGGVARLEKAAMAPVLVVFQQSRFCPLTSQMPARYATDMASVEGVADVLPTLVFVNQCQSNLDLVTIHGVDPDALTRIQRLRAVAGDLESWKSDPQGALVGARLAERRGLRVGDRVQLGNVDVVVGGIVEAEGPGLDNVAFVRLSQLQLARDLQGQVTQFLAVPKHGTDPAALARALDERFRTDEVATDTKPMQEFVRAAVGEIAELVGLARWLGYLAVAVVVLVLGNTVFISAQTRTAELGALETVGLPKPSLALLLVAESLVLALAGGVLGTGAVIAFFAANPTTLGIEGYGIDFVAGLPVAVAGLLASVGVGLLAAVGPALEALFRPLALAVRPA